MIVDGWVSWAVRLPSVPDKIYSTPNTGEGIAMHSVVGNLGDGKQPSRFLSTERTADGRYTPAAAASCMFILYKSGMLGQMYPVTASTWTSGGPDGNTRYWAIEAEGGLNPYTEPLTKAAEDAFIRLVTEWENHTGRKAQPGVNLLQHKEIARKYGYAATACASDRYQNALVRILAGERYKEEGMASKEYTELLTRIEELERALSAGSEEGGATQGEKQMRARYRIKEIADGKAQSYGDRATSAVALAKQALDKANEAQPEPRVKVIPIGTKFTAEVTE